VSARGSGTFIAADRTGSGTGERRCTADRVASGATVGPCAAGPGSAALPATGGVARGAADGRRRTADLVASRTTGGLRAAGFNQAALLHTRSAARGVACSARARAAGGRASARTNGTRAGTTTSVPADRVVVVLVAGGRERHPAAHGQA